MICLISVVLENVNTMKDLQTASECSMSSITTKEVNVYSCINGSRKGTKIVIILLCEHDFETCVAVKYLTSLNVSPKEILYCYSSHLHLKRTSAVVKLIL